MSDISYIVECLKKPPFEMKLTIVDFAQKDTIELLQCLNDVFVHIDEKQRVDIRQEQKQPEIQQQRILQFINVLNYSHDMPLDDFRKSVFAEPDAPVSQKAVVYPLLYYILQNFDQLQQRVYVAPFLLGMDIPEELHADEGIVDFLGLLTTYQTEFKQVHKKVSSMRPTHKNPADLQSGLDTLKKEKEQLLSKLARLKQRVETPEYANIDFDGILQMTNQLQQENEEENKLFNRLQEQKQKLARSHQRKQEAVGRLREMQSTNVAQQDPKVLLAKLKKEVKKNREYLNGKLDMKLQEQREELREMESQMTANPMTHDEVQDLEDEIASLERGVENLTATRDSQVANQDRGITTIRALIAKAEEKLERSQEDLEEAEEEKAETEEDLKKLDASIEKLLGEQRGPKTEAQMKQYLRDLKAKATLYTEKKQELQAAQSELDVLQRTEAILRTRDNNLQEFNEELEREKGVEGYLETQEKLEQVSEATSNLDERKGKTLDQMSTLIAKINKQAQQQQARIAPMIKDLHKLRKLFGEVEKVYKKAKSENDNRVMAYETEFHNLAKDVSNNIHAIQNEESNYHLLTMLHSKYEAKANRLRLEEEYSQTPDTPKLMGRFGTYKKMFEVINKETETSIKRMRQEKVSVRDSFAANSKQRIMFGNLKKLLQCKKDLLQEANNPQSFANSGMEFNEGGGERMMIE